MNEIEIRGKIDKKKFKELEKFLQEKAVLSDHYDRLTVDISEGFDPETKSWKNPSEIDLRLKKSGKNEKISVKVGHYTAKNREEFEVDLKEGEILDALKLFGALGYKTGMIYRWKSWIYKYNDFEIKISEYPNGYMEWEIESLDSASDPNDLANKLSLKPYTDEEFQKEIVWKNNNLHELYSLEKVSDMLKD
ncbi:MAG TPA: hypothetical protein VKC53_03925 [Patescibacteria group bacterium]|nr:hypothetical protein [Patescibacteria group bacterium]